jgi:hypothetical protein
MHHIESYPGHNHHQGYMNFFLTSVVLHYFLDPPFVLLSKITLWDFVGYVWLEINSTRHNTLTFDQKLMMEKKSHLFSLFKCSHKSQLTDRPLLMSVCVFFFFLNKPRFLALTSLIMFLFKTYLTYLVLDISFHNKYVWQHGIQQ